MFCISQSQFMFTVNILRFVDSNIYTNMISVILTDFCFCFFASDMHTYIKKKNVVI